MLMDFSKFTQKNQTQQYYQEPPQPMSKVKIGLIAGGIIMLITLLILLFTSGGSKPGQADMQRSLQAMSESIGVMDEYENDLQVSSTRNDVALIQIILRGNYQKLNQLYSETYDSKKFSSNPKPDEDSKEVLDRAVQNNTIDSEILLTLQPKIDTSEKYLKRAKPNFTKPSSVASLQKSIDDFASISDVLNKAR